ncbi:MAG: hypothetical protein ABJL67_21810 [Sulfitobacter sp.]
MGEFSIEGDELRKLIRVAKQRPLAFASSPGKDDGDFVFALHRKRTPDALSRAVKKESTTNKIAYGLCAIDGKLMSLTCEQELPGLARKLKKWLKKQKAPHNIKILDESGNLIEDDIEDLPDDPLDADGNDGGGGADLFDDEGAQTDPRVDALRQKVIKLVPQIRALSGPAHVKLQAAAKSVLELINAGDLEAAAKLIAAIGAGLKKAAGTQPASEDAKKATAELAEKLKTLRPECMAAKAPVNEKLMKVWEIAANKLRGQDFDGARTAIKNIEDALAKQNDKKAVDPLQGQWEALWARLSPVVLKAMKADVPNAQGLRAMKMTAEDTAASGDYKKAIAIAQRLGASVREALEAKNQQASEKPIGQTVDFTKTRLMWGRAKGQLRSEMARLGDAIVASCDGEDFKGIETAVKDLQTYIDPIGETLEDALDALIQETEVAKRDDLRQKCLSAINANRAEINSGIFQIIDDKNGFLSGLKVRRTAVAALDAMAKELEKEEKLQAA